MILYPAIDILKGQVVRLVQGDFSQQTVFSNDPLELLRQFQSEGAQVLHLVDLSGAKDPKDRQLELIEKLVRETSLKIQTGGGLRSTKEIKDLLDLGVDRVVLGSIAVTHPDVAIEALQTFGPDRLTFAVDVQIENGEPIVRTHGWTQSSNLTFREVIKPFSEHGLKRVLCTDIAVDGRLVGPNIHLYQSLQKEFPHLEIQASGGVEKLTDLQDLAKIKTHSVVVGRALLSGKFKLSEAFAYAE
jgi:phosphoribosylformimino-5-aminoimidazole carboxamide ribotide isomerase